MLKQLDYLKSVGGPFTSVEAVTAYLDSDDTDKKKAIRLKTEVQYARDTSTSLAKVNPLFRIRTQKIGDERARQLTCAEFATNIKKLISQKLGAVDKMITLQRFMSSLNTWKYTAHHLKSVYIYCIDHRYDMHRCEMWVTVCTFCFYFDSNQGCVGKYGYCHKSDNPVGVNWLPFLLTTFWSVNIQFFFLRNVSFSQKKYVSNSIWSEMGQKTSNLATLYQKSGNPIGLRVSKMKPFDSSCSKIWKYMSKSFF